jgi:hypothetical protein
MRTALGLVLFTTALAHAAGTEWRLERRMVACCGEGSPQFAAALAGGPRGVLVGVPAQGVGRAFLLDDATGGVLARFDAPAASRDFGRAVAAVGGALAVGAPDVASVFVYEGRATSPSRTLHDPHAGGVHEFGRALALGASDVVVGAPFDDAEGAGAVWVFARATGALRFALRAPAAQAGARFGIAVAIAGDDAIVGAAAENASGAVTAYSLRTGAVRWTRSAPASASGLLFGYAVAADARTVAVGAPCRDGTSDAGLAFVLDRATGETLHEIAGPRASACDFFGGAVAVGADAVVVGARHGGDRDTGAVHVFAASTGRPLASFADGAGTAQVGWAVATRGARVLAGAAGSEGDVRVYRRARD